MIDQSAPAIASGETEVGAPAAVVWQVMTDIDGWPAWNPDVKSARLEGALAPGTAFRWKAGPGTIRSRIEAVEPERLIAWSGSTMGIKAVHVWRMMPAEEGTRVETEESWSGLIVRLMRGRMQTTLQKAIDEGLHHLKAESEQRATG
jgi:hypothetical protein